MSLVDEAKRIPRKKVLKRFTADQIDLALAWLEDEVTLSQAKSVLYRRLGSNQSVHAFLCNALQEAFNRGILRRPNPNPNVEAILRGDPHADHGPSGFIDDIPHAMPQGVSWENGAWCINVACPYCTQDHHYGGGSDPRKLDLGHRDSHCPQDTKGLGVKIISYPVTTDSSKPAITAFTAVHPYNSAIKPSAKVADDETDVRVYRQVATEGENA